MSDLSADGRRTGLQGIRVLEVAGGFGPAWVAKLFGDLGADVVRLEEDGEAGAAGLGGGSVPAEGTDRVRGRPHQVHRWINANKRSMTTGRAELAATADILLHDLGPAAAAARGLTYDELARRSPRLVVCSITPFGMTGPYADYAAEELTVIHGCSWGFLTPSASTRIDLPPLKAFGHHATFQTGTVAAAAALAAFDRAERTGVGDHVDFSVYAAGAKMSETAPASAAFQGADSSRVGVKSVVPWGIYECRDGLIQFICVEEAQWQSLVRLMGSPEWATMDVFATLADRRENADLVELYLSEWMAEQKVDELYHAGQRARLCMSPVYDMAGLSRDAQLAARGFFAETPDGLRVTGGGFQVDQPWWALRRSAAERGQHDGEGWQDETERSASGGGSAKPAVAPAAPAPAPRATASAPGAVGRPLEGVRVCDFTWIWAGPMCTQYLAHLGADVIRLESPGHLCLFRRLPFNPPDLPAGPDTMGLFQLYNSDKRSVRLDLRHPDAGEVIRRLVARSDVVVENFAVGTLASLGFGVDELRRINPDVIVASLSGYGQTGPSADYMAYGPAGGAIAGLYNVTGYEDGPAAETGIAVGDPCTGITAAWAIVAALAARRRTGVPARIDVAMVEAVATTVGEAWMAYAAEGEEPARLGNHDPAWAPHNCYPAAGEDHWVTIACVSEAQWRALCEVVDPGLADDPRFTDAATRKANEADLDTVLAAWTAGRDRWETTRLLQARGVAAFPSQAPLGLWRADPQLGAIGMLERPDHPATGTYTVPGIPWRSRTGPNGLRRPAPLLGQHTEEVLTELLGYTQEEVARLAEAGALP